MESIESKTVFFLNKSLFTGELCQQVWPQGSRSPRLYGLRKIHKHGMPWRPTVNTSGSPTYRLAQCLARLLSGHMSHSHHIKKQHRICPCLEFAPSWHSSHNGHLWSCVTVHQGANKGDNRSPRTSLQRRCSGILQPHPYHLLLHLQ
jgi:hypothetical protein